MTGSGTKEAVFTPEDLLSLPDGDRYELVDGKLVERYMGSESSWVAGRIYRLLAEFVERYRLGWVWPPDAGYQCFPGSPNTVRRPDVSFVREGRLPGGHPAKGFETVAPDLVVEVVSPHEPFCSVDAKVEAYLRAGVKMVWVVNPETRSVTVHNGDATVKRLREKADLAGEEVLPGFRCNVSDFFSPFSEAD